MILLFYINNQPSFCYPKPIKIFPSNI